MALPTGAHDDEADALTQAVDRLFNAMGLGSLAAALEQALSRQSGGR